MVAVPGDGKDYEGVCDVCGRPLKLNKVNPVDLAFVVPTRQEAVQRDRPTWEQKAGSAKTPAPQPEPEGDHGP